MGTRIMESDTEVVDRGRPSRRSSGSIGPESVARASRRLRVEAPIVEPEDVAPSMLHQQTDIQSYLRQIQDGRTTPVPGATERTILLGAEMISSFAETIISHPSVILRRQCQASVASSWYHLTPFTLVQPVYYIHRNQGPIWMTRGLSSVFIVRALQTTIEATLSDVSGLPKEVYSQSSMKRLLKHLLLKFITALLVSPFYTAALVESVQSGVASEPAGLLDVLTEGTARLSVWHSPATGRMLPLWSVAPPLALLLTAKYSISSLAQHVLLSANKKRADRRLDSSDSDSLWNGLRQLHDSQVATLAGSVLADFLLLPIETIIHRLLLQGSRVLLDNVDTGVGVVPACSSYEGLWDCIRSTFVSEGVSGFYKGFGAIIAQYTIYAGVLRVMGLMLEQLEPVPEDTRHR